VGKARTYGTHWAEQRAEGSRKGRCHSDRATVSRVGLVLTILLLVGSLWTLVRTQAIRRTEAGSHSPPLVGQAILFAVAGGYLTYYAASEDSYRRGGISRWEAYDAHALTAAAILACLTVCVLAALADRRRGLMVSLAGPTGVAAALLFAAAFVANSTN
jgi:cytochrome bd-type quinol oxidase subunit 2